MLQQPSSILIVDDGAMGRSALDALLRPAGYQLEFATNGYEALAVAADIIPDLILLDVMMPEMDGFEVCSQLRATPQLAEVPIILLTALDDRESRLRGIQAGADDFLSKPFDRIELRTRVQTITRLNRYRRLLSARAQFEWVVEHASDGYLVVQDDGSISYANPHARRLLGLPSNPEVPLPHTFQVYAQQQYQCEPKLAWDMWSAPKVPAPPMYLVLPESASIAAFWVQVDTFNVPPPSVTRRIVRLRDVTNQITMQRDIQRFHAMINHKLRTPLVSIMTSLELLTKYQATLSSDDISTIVEIANSGTKRLRGELEDILQYTQAPVLARPNQGATIAQFFALINDIAATLELPPVNTTWEPHMGDMQIPLSLRAVELVLREILENSKKFHPTHTPTITTTAHQSQPTTFHLLIRDNGSTLTPKQLAHAWLPYYQAEKEFTGQIDGMGLGLALVSNLVWSVGGTCRISNRIDTPGIELELVFQVRQAQPILQASSHNMTTV